MPSDSRANHVCVRELIGWDLDENELRPASAQLNEKINSARAIIASRPSFRAVNPVATETPAPVTALLNHQLAREDLQREMDGLDWFLAVVELRQLLAFQRRLVFDPEYTQIATPTFDAWPALTALAFGPPVPAVFTTIKSTPAELVVQSSNPNLCLRPAADNCRLEFHGGSPFFEAAEYRDRWFLRDGYHRAEFLLRSGITQVPAVVIRARTLAELGAVGPWFFSEQSLFGPHPPYVSDFLDESLTQQYTRPRLHKTLRVTIEESFVPDLPHSISGEQL